MKHGCGERGYWKQRGQRNGGRRWGKGRVSPRGCRWRDFHPRLGSYSQMQCPDSVHHAPRQLRPGGLKTEEQAQRGGRLCNASMHYVPRQDEQVWLQVSGNWHIPDTQLQDRKLPFHLFGASLMLAELYCLSTNLEILAASLYSGAEGHKMFTQIRNRKTNQRLGFIMSRAYNVS